MKTVFQCPLCKSAPEHHRFFERVIDKLWVTDHYELRQFIYAICGVCGMVFQWDRMDDAELTAYYAEQYRMTIQGGTDKITDRVIHEQQLRAQALLSATLPEKVTNVLDIGSSTGVLLTALIEKYNCQGVGVEPGEKFRYGSQVKAVSELEILGAQRLNTFDLITMIHTLEHIPDPVEYLIQLHDWITDDGHLLIEVPHLYNDSTLRISHPISFTPKTLRETLLHAGFEISYLVGFSSFKTEYPGESNILALCRPGIIDDRVAFVDIEKMKQEYQEGQRQLREYLERKAASQTDKAAANGTVQPVSG